MSKLTSKKVDDFYHFYWSGRDITLLWMDFFSSLPMKQEKNAHWIFARRYGKELDKLTAPKPKDTSGRVV
jgi:hypothetical protein